MTGRICRPKTFLNHPSHWKLIVLLQKLFIDPDPEHITEQISNFLDRYPIPMEDFPVFEKTYTRTILCRSENGFEAMAARWAPGVLSSIHGHPYFTLYFVVEGKLAIDNYKQCGDQVKKMDSNILSRSQFFSATGRPGTFNNHIHQVKAVEETLSIHVSSDDAAKGQIFSRIR